MFSQQNKNKPCGKKLTSGSLYFYQCPTKFYFISSSAGVCLQSRTHYVLFKPAVADDRGKKRRNAFCPHHLLLFITFHHLRCCTATKSFKANPRCFLWTWVILWGLTLFIGLCFWAVQLQLYYKEKFDLCQPCDFISQVRPTCTSVPDLVSVGIHY